MKDAAYWINRLGLTAHPEGGFFRETYRAAGSVSAAELSEFDGPRSFSTAIYFLLRSLDRSVFHRIKSDELWHFYAGTSVDIYVLQGSGLKTFRLADPSLKDGQFQLIVPAGCWFAARVNDPESYALCGCTVAPGFDFRDFEIADRKLLLKEFPTENQIIEQLTR
jgi:predicted cupin superfamily sugar epimerase